MMKIKLMIYSNLKNYVEDYNDHDGVVKEVSGKKTIRQFLEEIIKHEQAMDAISMVIVNDKIVPFNQLDRELQDGDMIKVYPPMGGG
jgi:molybdopterin converting factor small subunit